MRIGREYLRKITQISCNDVEGWSESIGSSKKSKTVEAIFIGRKFRAHAAKLLN